MNFSFCLYRLLLAAFIFLSASLQAQDGDNRVLDQSEIGPGENIDQKIKDNFFLRAEVSKTDCYVGEVLMATFKAYSRIDANSQVVKRPSLTGFSVIEMVDAYNTLPEVEMFRGVYYNTHLIRKVQLFPLQAGHYTLEAAEIESVLHLRKTAEPPKGLLNRLLRRNLPSVLVQKNITLETPALEINVRPLPEKGQPEDFPGAVGKFSVKMEIADSNVRQYQPAKIKLTIEGTGNLPLITDPSIDWPAGMQVPEPQVTEETDQYRFPLSGRKSFEFSLPANETGLVNIPAVKFTYFDPGQSKYRIAETMPLSYRVIPADKTPQAAIETGHKKAVPLEYLYFGILVAVILVIVIRYIYNRHPAQNEKT